ncbi:FAD-binding oxidoreductase [Falsihalocynthiibacter sp. S25ZX9]|uniref:FAD-binding oxidoreductase n=1 Tax=Falsihalocynthiibacter sp. S25ZX9 TaxID=3240870 RepID=UPI00350F2D81
MTIHSALTKLSLLLGDRLSRSKSDLNNHGQSETYFPLTPPDAVAYPDTTLEVSEILKICHAEDCPVVAWGAGTSLEGHALATQGGICLDMIRMSQIGDLRIEDFAATVGPGITRESLNQELRTTGLFFPVDPGANASLGGMAATRASGTTSVRYGTMRDNVLGLTVVLADGRIVKTGGPVRKSSSGYDLTALFLGSEGTLGIITSLTLRLQSQPEAISAASCAFENMDAAIETVITTIQYGIPMARIEFVDAATAGAFNAYAGTKLPETPHLLVEFHGSERAVAEDAKRFGEIVEEMGGTGFDWSDKPEDRTALWRIRHNAYYACLALRPGAFALVTDVCVPISELAKAVRETRADIDASPLIGPILGHVGDGNFHAILLIDRENEGEVAEAKRLAQAMAERAISLGGTITGEHGIGLGKRHLMAQEHGQEAWDLMGQIKNALDPTGILNPGKIVP